MSAPLRTRRRKFTRYCEKAVAVWLLLSTVMLGVLPPRPVLAQAGADLYGFDYSGYSDAELKAINPSLDPVAVRAHDAGKTESDNFKWLKDKLKEFLKTAGAVAYKKALTYFLTKIATDTATRLASGGKGQKPMYETEGWGAYLSRVGDSAAGHFIEEFAANAGLPNLCTPSFNLKLKLSLGLLVEARPPAEPSCTFTQLSNNWQQFINNPPRLNEIIAAQFSPYDNDLAIGFGVWSSFYSTVEGVRSDNTLARLESEGFKALTGLDGSILTPGSLIRNHVTNSLDPELLSQVYFKYTGEAVADAVDAFTSTLIAKSLTRLFEKGFNPTSKPERYDWSRLEGLRSPTADTSARAGDIRQEFEAFFSTTLAVGDPRLNRIDVTSQLVGEGVISPVFKTAIDRKLTVRQALDQGLLYGDGAGSSFGFTRAGTQPDSNEGYSYNSLVILRKYRILPVGWELAAAYIGKLEQRRIYSLNDVIRGFADPDSPFFGLVDDGWVLKAPETYCRLRGMGDQLAAVYTQEETIIDRSKPSDPTTGQPVTYQFQRRVASRQDTCVDMRSCVVEDSNGNCRSYGLCTEERPIWRFSGSECPAQYDSCRTYETGDNRTASFLARTLDAGDCGAESVGCSWYCRDFNVGSGVWSCVSEGEQVRKACQQSGRCSVSNATVCTKDAECPRGETCQGASCLVTDVGSGVSCEVPYGAVSCTVPGCGAGESFVGNGGFETESPSLAPSGGSVAFAASWQTTDLAGPSALWQRVSGVGNQIAGGTFATRVEADGTRSRMTAESVSFTPPVASPPYTLTAQIYSTLLFGRAYLEVVPAAGAGCTTADADIAKGQWATVSCASSVNLAGARVRLVVEATSGVNPVGTVWFDDISVERSCPLKDVTVYLEGTQHFDGSKIYFDRDVSACSQEESGCRMLIPTADAHGVNLVYNASFEDWPDPSNALPPGWFTPLIGGVARVDEQAAAGQRYLRYTAGGPGDARFSTEVIAGVQPGRTYQVSLYARSSSPAPVWRARLGSAGAANPQHLVVVGEGKCFDAAVPVMTLVSCRNNDDCIRGPTAPSADPGNYCTSPLPLTTAWQRFTFEPIEASLQRDNFQLQFDLTAPGTPLELDGVQVIAVAARSAPAEFPYSDYTDNPVTYLKTPPEYLGCAGDPTTDHSACSRYALVCRADEVGCQRYTPTNGEPALSAITSAADSCPRACVDYSAFSQSETFFSDAVPSSLQPDFLYFIARTARQCSAQFAGCEEFTNLDELSQGGEGKGSYTYLRQCTKPDANVCRTYYTWVGSEINGYQLKSYNLRRDLGGADAEAPDVADIPNRERLGNCQYNGKPAPGGADTCGFDSSGGAITGETWDPVGLGCVNPIDQAKFAQTNPNCREFYAANGGIYYRLLRETVACSADCHPFRLLDTSQAACEGSNGYWGVCSGVDLNGDATPDDPATFCLQHGGMQLVGSSDCFMTEARCVNPPADPDLPGVGGTFTPRAQCVYQAVPAESQSCPAAQSGCREYRGNSGNNIQTVFTDDFEDGDTVGFADGTISSDAITVGGHSIVGDVSGGVTRVATQLATTPGSVACNGPGALPACDSSITMDCYNAATDSCPLQAPDGSRCAAHGAATGCGVISELMSAGRSYQLNFWAKAQTGVANINVTLLGVACGVEGTNPCPLFTVSRVTTEWEEFTSKPIIVTGVAPDAVLEFTAVNADTGAPLTVAFDFITLTQVRAYNYLVKNSWQTPQICDTNPTLDPSRFPPPNAPQFALGCQEYTSADGSTAYLKSFDHLCRDSSVGCAEFIDTFNSTSALEERFNVGHPQSEVIVPPDRLRYYVADPAKSCAASAKGCSAVGSPTLDALGTITSYQTKYLINDPERYSAALCTEEQVGCQEYVSPQSGTAYFRDPGARTCQYRQIPQREDFGWFIAGSTSGVPDCPVTTYLFGQTQPGKTCLGGDLNGQACASDADCSFKVCRGGVVEGARCADDPDCGTGTCELQAGSCRSWVGQCPAEYASCTTYVDPLSDPQAGVLPNGNFEGFFRACSNDGQTICRLDSECQQASGGKKYCVTDFTTVCDSPATCPGNAACEAPVCSVSKLHAWTIDEAAAKHLRGGGLNGSSAVQINAPTNAVRQTVALGGGTLYTISAWVKNSAADAAITISTSNGSSRDVFTQFDHSVAILANGILASTGDTVVLSVGGVSDAAFRRFVGRFFVTETDRGVTVTLSNIGTYDGVDIKPTGIYRYLADSLDRTSCNGIYDPAQGCVLVNDTGDPTLRYSTAASTDGQAPAACLPQACVGGGRAGSACTRDEDCAPAGKCQPGTCDANLLVTVAPDRTCATWLDCISSRTSINFVNGNRQTFCQQLATCDRLDPISGRCSSYPTEELQPLQFNAGSVQLAQNFSGNAKVGFQWDADTKVDGYFPYGVMTQKKICVAGKVDAVCLEDVDCNTEGNRDGRCQPVLQVGLDPREDILYESCRIYPQSNSPRWGAQGPVDTGAAPAKTIITDTLDPFAAQEFGSGRSATLLEEASECHYLQGKSEYVGLYGFCVEPDPRSPYLCLSWLPVDELTGGWVGVTGWRDNVRPPLYLCTESAALETRRPNRYQVDHCFRSSFSWEFLLLALIPGYGPIAVASLAAANYAEVGSMRCGTVRCPPGYVGSISDSSCGNLFQPGLKCKWSCKPDPADLHHTDAKGVNWYDYKARKDIDGRLTKNHLMYCPECGQGQVLWNDESSDLIARWNSLDRDVQLAQPFAWKRVCDKFVSLVAPDGSNRAWKERLEALQDFITADYLVPDLNYKLEEITLPFGAIGREYVGDPAKFPLIESMVRGEDFANPLWPEFPGGAAGQMYYDKYFDLAKDRAADLRAVDTVPVSSFHGGRERIKRLFATSFGDWRWNGTAYEPYNVAQNYCAGGPLSGQDCTGPDTDADGVPDPDDAMCADNFGGRPPSTCQLGGGFCTYYPDTDPSDQRDADELDCGSHADCTTGPICAYGTCGSFGDDNESNDTDRPCKSNADCAIDTGGAETCSVEVPVFGRCKSTTGDPAYRLDGVACPYDAADKFCDTQPTLDDGTCDGADSNGAPAPPGTYGKCSAGINMGRACLGPGDGDCRPANQVAKCVGACSFGSATPGARCTEDATCQINGECKPTTAWLPPANRCQDNVRPANFTENPLTDPGGRGDWCGVSPEIFNAKLENAQSPIYLGVDNVPVTISFNVKVDNDQLPLRQLLVKWDMANLDKEVSDPTQNALRSGMRDKADPRDPFQLSHTYRYSNDCDPGGAIGYCEFQIGIMVRDNWCWCSNGNELGDQAFAGVNPSNNECNACPSEAWFKPAGTLVRVCSTAAAALCGVAPGP